MRHGTPSLVRAMTLFEVIISIALITMLLGALISFFWQTLEIRQQAEHEADRTQIAQQMLERMADELRGAVAFQQVGFEGLVQFEGDRRRVTFLTAPLPPEESYRFFQQPEDTPLPQHDLRQITYELWIDPEEETDEGDPVVAGILRTERRALDPYITEAETAEDEVLEWVRRDLWTPELGYLEFRYFDGAEWVPRWEVTEGNKLPHQVMVTVGFDSLTQEQYEDQDLDEYPFQEYPLGPDVPNPNRYSKIVRIPAADQMFSARLYRLSGETEEIYEFLGGAVEEGEGMLEGLEGMMGGEGGSQSEEEGF